ncbi:hypothetical protein THAOC_11347 [Thalassiosira oceanica]|uniref:Uncharacterized protein n=1 Tax=Thalassiosira oceanica TaxID=159749 RepID=K0TAS9_THAOC|nr:hypothetical protein THAOC_11347 [Thalassiosira oceanica]|eukprot:EJK67597.1 hypothetical protein THAOC_11347 [Thalassiosira oceanica]
MPSRCRPQAAIGKPSFACFPVDYLPDVWGLTSQPTCQKEISPMQRRTKDPKTSAGVGEENVTGLGQASKPLKLLFA